MPSVLEQSVGLDKWFVFMADDTPPEFKDRILSLAGRHPFLIPVFCNVFSAKMACERVRETSPENAHMVITSRLDNDDMLHPRYVERVRHRALVEAPRRDLSTGFFVSFPLGCSLRDGNAYFQRYRNNPFSSFVATPKVNRTVLDVDHRYVADMAPVVYEWRRPMWCQVIHGENVANVVRGVYWPFERTFSKKAPKSRRTSLFWRAKEFFSTAVSYPLRRQGK